jgi:hypothetical protein
MRAVWLREALPWIGRPSNRVLTAAPATTVSRQSLHEPDPDAHAYVDAALRLTAIALLLRPMGSWFVSPAILALAVVVLIVPRALRHPLVWGSVSLLVAVRIVSDWPLADNHIYLLCYWALAIALALRTSHASRNLAFSSRWLIGLAFVFAVLWKAVLAPDFLDGRFFRVTLLTDPRFEAVAQLVGGLSQEQLDANRQALVALPHGAELLDPPVVHEPARLRALAGVATFGVLVLEAAVALLMMGPTIGIVVMARHAALLLFCGLTYAFAPVAGFGWLLLVMGLAQLAPRQVWLGRAYIAMFLAVLFYGEVPWAELMLDLVR